MSRTHAPTSQRRSPGRRSLRQMTTATIPHAVAPIMECPEGKAYPCSTTSGSSRSGRTRSMSRLNPLFSSDAMPIVSALAIAQRGLPRSARTTNRTPATAVTAHVEPSSVMRASGARGVSSAGWRTKLMIAASTPSVSRFTTSSARALMRASPATVSHAVAERRIGVESTSPGGSGRGGAARRRASRIAR